LKVGELPHKKKNKAAFPKDATTSILATSVGNLYAIHSINKFIRVEVESW